jgi:hypothetical protein
MSLEVCMTSSKTRFGSLSNYEKGGVQTISDDPKHYAFSNVFEVASKSKPYEKVAVAKNLRYVIEALRAEGDSAWFACAHDEAALVMDGDVEVHLVKPDQPQVPENKEGAIKLAAEPKGRKMGWVRVGKGHMALLPKGSAYQFRSKTPGVIMLQTIQGENTIERWDQICQTK